MSMRVKVPSLIRNIVVVAREPESSESALRRETRLCCVSPGSMGGYYVGAARGVGLRFHERQA